MTPSNPVQRTAAATPPRIEWTGDRATVTADSYRLELRSLTEPYGRLPHALLYGADGRLWMDITLLGSADTIARPDETSAIERVDVEASSAGVSVIVRAVSTAWDRRELRMLCTAETVELSLELRGDGELGEVTLLGGRASLPSGASGVFRSGIGFASVLVPAVTEPVQFVRPAGSSAVLGCVGDADPGRLSSIFSPPPLVLGLGRESPVGATDVPGGQWLGMSLRAPVHELGFIALNYDALDGGFLLKLDYEGHTTVRGQWRSPAIVLRPTSDGWSVLDDYRSDLVANGMAAEDAPHAASWWREPIFCGWGAQSARAVSALKVSAPKESAPKVDAPKVDALKVDAPKVDALKMSALKVDTPERDPGGASSAEATPEEERIVAAMAPTLARQDVYDELLDGLETDGVRPGTIVIDDRWQAEYGAATVDTDHWPDLRGWIARRHARGQRVLLWWKAWDAAGIPADECVRDAAGRALSVDPGNPAYLARLRAIVAGLLSADGLDADGFKVDFTQRGPSGRTLTGTPNVWGVAALHALLAELHGAARAAKPDALVVCHAVHPSFGDTCGMVRLNDVSKFDVAGDRVPVVDQLRMRQAIVRRILPGHLIDTDQWPMPNRAEWLRYAHAQVALGVPALYYTESIDRSGERIEPGDLTMIADTWRHYRDALDGGALDRDALDNDALDDDTSGKHTSDDDAVGS